MDRKEWAEFVKAANKPKPKVVISPLQVDQNVFVESRWAEGDLIEPSADQLKIVTDLNANYPELNN